MILFKLGHDISTLGFAADTWCEADLHCELSGSGIKRAREGVDRSEMPNPETAGARVAWGSPNRFCDLKRIGQVRSEDV